MLAEWITSKLTRLSVKIFPRVCSLLASERALNCLDNPMVHVM